MRRTNAARSIGVTDALAIALVGLAALGCIWSWMSYTYLFGAKVTILPGAACLSELQATSGKVTCDDAMWVIGENVDQGTLVDYRQSAGEFAYDEIPARLVGHTARTRPPTVTYQAGLVAPPVLVGSVVVFLARLVSRRRARISEYQPSY